MDRRSFMKALLASSAVSTFCGVRGSSGAEYILNARNAPQSGTVLVARVPLEKSL